MGETRAAKLLRAGKPLSVDGPRGIARVERASEGFTVSISGKFLRRFSDPGPAIHFAQQQVRYLIPEYVLRP